MQGCLCSCWVVLLKSRVLCVCSAAAGEGRGAREGEGEGGSTETAQEGSGLQEHAEAGGAPPRARLQLGGGEG